MKRFRRQPFSGVFALLAATALALWLHRRFCRILPDYAFLTGWVLLAAMLALAFYNARKKLPFLPLGNSETWLQIHIYLGFFTVLLFLIHLNFRLPRGWFEITLAWLFALVCGSGVAGLLFSRVLPRRLATRGGEVIYEKIPALRHALKTEAERLSLGAEAKSPLIAEFYARELAGFFAGRIIAGCIWWSRAARSMRSSPPSMICAAPAARLNAPRSKSSPRSSARRTASITIAPSSSRSSCGCSSIFR